MSFKIVPRSSVSVFSLRVDASSESREASIHELISRSYPGSPDERLHHVLLTTRGKAGGIVVVAVAKRDSVEAWRADGSRLVLPESIALASGMPRGKEILFFDGETAISFEIGLDGGYKGSNLPIDPKSENPLAEALKDRERALDILIAPASALSALPAGISSGAKELRGLETLLASSRVMRGACVFEAKPGKEKRLKKKPLLIALGLGLALFLLIAVPLSIVNEADAAAKAAREKYQALETRMSGSQENSGLAARAAFIGSYLVADPVACLEALAKTLKGYAFLESFSFSTDGFSFDAYGPSALHALKALVASGAFADLRLSGTRKEGEVELFSVSGRVADESE